MAMKSSQHLPEEPIMKAKGTLSATQWIWELRLFETEGRILYYWPLNCPGVIGSLELPLPVATETQSKMLQLFPSWPSLLVSWYPGNVGCLETDDIPSLGVVCYNSRLEGCYPNWPSLDSTIGWFSPLITTVSCAIILKICFCVTWEIKLHVFL